MKNFKNLKNLEILKSYYLFRDSRLRISKKFSEKLNNQQINIQNKDSEKGIILNIIIILKSI
jgi:4-hydroxyphenylpyruvate dioxygenase-like putative hemolysin